MTDLEREAREAAEEAADLQYPGQDGIAAQLRGEHAHGYHNGYLAAAEPREKEIAILREYAANLEEDARLYSQYVRRNPPVDMRGNEELATLRARVAELEAWASKVPVEEIEYANDHARGCVDSESTAIDADTIDRWLATVKP